MKIMIITLNTYGGMIHYVSQLANALSKREDVVVIAPVGIEREYFLKDVKIIKLHLGDTIKNIFINTLALTRPLKFLNTIYKEKPDLIHFNECHLWSSLFLPLFIRFPIVTTLHDINPHYGTPISRKLNHMFGKKMHIRFSDCLIVHGVKIKNELKTKQRCYVIPHGDYTFFLNYKDGRVEEESTILFFGRILKYKGLEYLLRSIPLISLDFPDIKLIIAGSGDFNTYNQMILNNKNYEVHNRFISDEEVTNFFQRAKVIVLPYTGASQSGIIPIAYAFKKPVVVTDVGSISEVVDDEETGLIVPPKDEKALADAIIRLLKDDELRKVMGENAYKKMKEELSWDRIAEKTIEVYKGAINEHKRRGTW
jgi:glycosyltransferase involved in cell wall biosynthesis